MTATLSFEWLKLSKRWMPRIIAALVIALTIVAFWGYGTRAAGRANLFMPRGPLAALTFSAFFAPFFWPVLGGSWAGNEYGWGTIRTILTRRPERIEHLLGALAVLLFGTALATLAVVVVGGIAGDVVAALTGNTLFVSGVFSASFLAILLKGFLAAWFVSSFYLVLAYAAATIFRSAAVGIGVGIGVTLAQFVLLGIFQSLGGFWQTMAHHFPIEYSTSMITRVVGSGLIPGSGLAATSPTDPSATGSLIALSIYGGIALLLALLAVRTRDVTA